MADQTVLGTLLARNGNAGAAVMSTASDAQRFFEAVYGEEPFNVIVVDDRQVWASWRSVVGACAKHRPNALVILLVSAEHSAEQCERLLGDNVAAVYPRNSAGLLALARLVSTLSAQQRSFSLRRDVGQADTDPDDVVRMTVFFLPAA